ncbi:MAG: rhamnosidase [Planctomycetes bacterium]|nr:rhamnosidase [Planctomycetota bacterium]
MTRTRFAPLVVVALVVACLPARREAPAEDPQPTLSVRAPTCEHRVDPLGIDAVTPRLSWKLDARDPRARGLAQSAYQILVASDEAQLARGAADLWDSGIVASNATVDVAYAGAALVSNQRCAWKVRVWDQDGVLSEWSPVARFGIGLCAPGDWQARWIGYDAPAAHVETPSRFAEAKWIWFGGDPDEAPAAERYFRAHIAIEGRVRHAELALSVDNQWQVFVNGSLLQASEGNDAWRTPAVLDVTQQLFHGDNVLAVQARNESAGAAGLLARLAVELEDGSQLELVSDASWIVSDQPAAEWVATGFDDSAWTAARELAPYGGGPWGKLEATKLFLPPPRVLRREFTSRAQAVRATLYASALGLVEFELNGQRVGDELFTPGWTDYEKRVPYRAYDVSALVHGGANALGATLADGWYAGHVGYGGHRDHYGTKTRLLAQLVLEHADGSREVVCSDERWRASTGPLLEADFLMGESYDARRETSGWSSAGFDDAAWKPVDVGADETPLLGAHPGPPVRVVAEFEPTEVWAVGPDSYVCNLGQNIAGFARIAVRGGMGQKVVLRYAERLNPERTLYTANLRGARATDSYVCKGGGLERWMPRFTFHGFQYIEVTGLGRKPEAGDVVGLAITSDTPYIASLTTSEPALARLLENIRWTQRMNFIDIPTDCPQRDERLGWTGDAQAYARTATWNADVQAFFAKWLVDLADAQRADGQFPMVAPLKVAGDDGGPAWADAGVICPWTMYETYGDRQMLQRAYPSMQRFLEFCEQRSGADCLPPEEFHCFGDWVAVGGDTPHEVIYTAYFARCARLMQKSAEALGKTADAARYAELFARVKQAFNEAYVDAQGQIRGDTQCAYALALSFELLDGARREQAAQRLVADIEARGGHFSTGFVGTKDLLLALNTIGREDVAYRLLLGRTYPSWLFEIENGATSIWERWDGWTPEKGFQDPGMNSFAHYAFGAVGEWMFATIGGLGADQPGFAHLDLRPRPGGGLTHAEVEHDSIRGPIELHWRLDGTALELEVSVPPNIGATLLIPARSAESVSAGGQPLAAAPGVTLGATEARGVRVELVSGRYRFRCTEPVLVGGP